MTTKEKFIEMAKNITRPGIDEMMAWLETTDFYDAPASTRFHAVNNHMGVTNSANSSGVWQCYEMYTLSWLLHVADEAATVIDKI